MDYFKERRNDLLVVCWEDGDAWMKLCKFLDREIPDTSFPIEHRSPSFLSMMTARLKRLTVSGR